MEQDFSDWWARWWKQDFSWEGLAEKRWWGFVCLPDGSVVEETDGMEDAPATLQDYWRDQERHLIESPASGRKYTCIHLPLAWEDGTPTGKADWTEGSEDLEAYRAALRLRLNAPVIAMLQGAVLLGFNIRNLIDDPRSSEEHIVIRIPIDLETAFFLETLGSRTPPSPEPLISRTPPSPKTLTSRTPPSPEALCSRTLPFAKTLTSRKPSSPEPLCSKTSPSPE